MLSTELEATQLAWVSGIAPAAGSLLTAKVRYRQQDQVVSIEQIDENRMRLKVLYDGDVCLGGGIIETMNTPPMSNQFT